MQLGDQITILKLGRCLERKETESSAEFFEVITMSYKLLSDISKSTNVRSNDIYFANNWTLRDTITIRLVGSILVSASASDSASLPSPL